MIKVRICRGTVCHVMGGANLPLLSDYLSEEIKNKVSIEGTTCLGYCNQDDGEKPPFVEVGGEIIAEASFAKIIDCIKKKLNE